MAEHPKSKSKGGLTCPDGYRLHALSVIACCASHTGLNVLNIIPEFSHEGDEGTRHAKPPDDEEHEQLDGLQRLVRAPQPLQGEVGLGVHVGVQDLAEYPPCLQPVGPHVKHILQVISSLKYH